jgi:hypothetical protein
MRLTWQEKDHSRDPCDQTISHNNQVLPHRRVHHFVNVASADVRLHLVLDTPFGITTLFKIIAGSS